MAALVHQCTKADDPPAFARALSVLGSSAQRAGTLALLLDPDGQVVASAGSTGQIQTWNRVSVDPDPTCLDIEGDGWFESALSAFYVHQARPFSRMRGGRIAVAEIDELRPEAPGRHHAAGLEAVYKGLDSAKAACRCAWPALRDAIAAARAVADALRDKPDFWASGCALSLDGGL